MKFERIPFAALLLGFGVALPAFADDLIVKIGHVAPITGQQAEIGKDNENGARMAIEDLNSKGMVIGGKKVHFELIAEDDGADPKQGTAVAQKLVDENVSGVIGHLNSGTTIPASTIYFNAGIPQISPSSTDPQYTHNGYTSAFRVVANDIQLGQALGRYAVKDLKAKNVAVVSDMTSYGNGVASEFTKAAKAAGAQIVDQEYTNDKSTDFQAILTTIKGKKPDLVFYGGMYSQAGPLIRQARALGIDSKFVGGDGICVPKLADLAGAAIGTDTVYCAEAGGVTPDREKVMEDFRARFKKKYGVEVQIYAPYVYDAVMVMADAMKKANSSDPSKYLPFLAKESYEGVTGRIEFDDHGDIKNGTLTLRTYRAGKLEKLEVLH